MKINYDTDKIHEILRDLHTLTGLTLALWDNNMNLMVIYPPEQSSFCREIRSKAKGLERCLECDRIILKHCAVSNTVCTRDCHAGLPDSALPLYYDELLLGYITFGQLVNVSAPHLSYEEIKNRVADLDVDDAYLFRAYMELPRYNSQMLDAVTSVVSMCIQHVLIAKIVSAKNDELHETISEYIEKNVANPLLTYRDIIKEFHVSKSSLYNLFSEKFGMPPHAYIESRRIRLGAKLLLDTPKSILEIAISTGINDQNYFSRIFKKHLGLSPTQYRNTFRKT